MSSPAALSAATICSPLKTLDATDGERKSPASTSNGVRPSRGELLLERRDAREAADAVDRHGRVDVVDLEDRERRLRARRRRFFLLGNAVTR